MRGGLIEESLSQGGGAVIRGGRSFARGAHSRGDALSRKYGNVV